MPQPAFPPMGGCDSVSAMKRALAQSTLLLALAGVLAAQAQPQFEAASVRQFNLGEQNGCIPRQEGGPGTASPTRLTIQCTFLGTVIENAYGVRGYRTVGFDKIGYRLVSINATMAEGTTREQMLAMLRGLLEERFQVKVHREMREANGYELTVEKTGHKLRENTKPAEAGEPAPQPLGAMDGYGMPELPNKRAGTVQTYFMPGKARARGFAAPLSKLTELLEPYLRGAVVDHTGLGSTYDFLLDFQGPEFNVITAEGNVRPTTATEYFEPIPTALRKQLGLHLETTKTPAEFLVLDSILAKPLEN